MVISPAAAPLELAVAAMLMKMTMMKMTMMMMTMIRKSFTMQGKAIAPVVVRRHSCRMPCSVTQAPTALNRYMQRQLGAHLALVTKQLEYLGTSD